MAGGRHDPARAAWRPPATALDLPQAEHNALLTATGFAPVFPEHPLSHEALAGVQFVVQRLLSAYAPYPALVLNARYDIVDLNAGARSLLRALGMGRRRTVTRTTARRPAPAVRSTWWSCCTPSSARSS